MSKHARTDEEPTVSVIMPVHNASETLDACLSSVMSNTGISFEVIVVDDASTDDSRRIARGYDCRLIELQTNVFAANARNIGSHEARGELLFFFDADQVMPSDTIERMHAALQAHAADAVVASFTADLPLSGFITKFKNLRHHHHHQVARRDGCTLASGFTLVRKSVFHAFGGFEAAFGASNIEDVALGMRMSSAGHRIRFEPEIQVTHLKGYTMWQLIRSDVVDRAVPWTALALRERQWKNDLNTDRACVFSVGLAGLMPLLPLAGLPGLLALSTALLAMAALNRPLLMRGRDVHGIGFAGRAALFLPIMYFSHGVGLVWGAGSYLSTRQVGAPTRRGRQRTHAGS